MEHQSIIANMTQIHNWLLASLVLQYGLATVSAANPNRSLDSHPAISLRANEAAHLTINAPLTAILTTTRSEATTAQVSSVSSLSRNASVTASVNDSHVTRAKKSLKGGRRWPMNWERFTKRRWHKAGQNNILVTAGNATFASQKKWFESHYYPLPKPAKKYGEEWTEWNKTSEVCCFRLDVRLQTKGFRGPRGKFFGQLQLNDAGDFTYVHTFWQPPVSIFEKNRVCHQDSYLFTERGKWCGFGDDGKFICNFDAPTKQFKDANFLDMHSKNTEYPLALMTIDGDQNWIICETGTHKHRGYEIYKLPFSNNATIPGHCRVAWLDNRVSCHRIRHENMPLGFTVPNHFPLSLTPEMKNATHIPEIDGSS